MLAYVTHILCASCVCWRVWWMNATLEEALAQVVVEDADLIAAVEAMQDEREKQVAKRVMRKRLAKVARLQAA